MSSANWNIVFPLIKQGLILSLLFSSGCESTDLGNEPAAPLPQTAEISKSIYEVQEVDRPPIPRLQTKPDYPFEQRAKGQEGKVLIGFVVNQAGLPEDVKVLETENESFNNAAIDSVKSWRFSPGEKDNEIVSVALQVPIFFSIHDPNSVTRVARTPPSGKIINLSEADEKPVMKNPVKPIYPFDLKKNGIEGKALISFVVGVDGFTHHLKVVRTTHDEFGVSAIQALAQWQFTPGKEEGKPVNIAMQMPIVFTITD